MRCRPKLYDLRPGDLVLNTVNPSRCFILGIEHGTPPGTRIIHFVSYDADGAVNFFSDKVIPTDPFPDEYTLVRP